MPLESQIEAILFYRSEPTSFQELAKILGVNEADIPPALERLAAALTGRGVTVVRENNQAFLGTASGASQLIDAVRKEELNKDLGKAGLETLAIIFYCGPIARADIDYIRGVNSSFILRHLLIRGLVERENNPHDTRAYLYKPTIDILAHLGLNQLTDLPEYKTVREQIASWREDHKETNNAELENSNQPA